jgi:hypothetical protein
MNKNFLCLLATSLALFSGISAVAQDEDLLKLISGDEKPQKERIKYAFKSPRVINGHSMEFLNPGTMDFRILHRFGQLDQGYKNFSDLTRQVCVWGLISAFCTT